jgi:hypothetical protein
MKQSTLPEIPEAALRDYSKGPHINRGWKRLEQDLGPALVQRRSALWWAPALAVVTFGAGLFVGAKFLRGDTVVPVEAERSFVPQPAQGPVATPVPAPETKKPNKVATPRVLPRVHDDVEAPVVEEVVVESPSEEPNPYTPAPQAGPPEWEQLANAGDFAAAKRALERVGGFNTVVRSAGPGELMTLADIARVTGERDQALRALRRLLEVYPGADEAPPATWTLANLLDQAGDKVGASQAYALYRRLSPTGDFAEDAAAREVQFALSQGNVERAAVLLEEYARNFPKSRRITSFQKQLGKLAAPQPPSPEGEKTAPLESDEEDDEVEEASPVPQAH